MMPSPQPNPNLAHIKMVMRVALLANIAIMLIKFAAFFITNSAAVLSDAFESIVNIVAAAVMVYSITLSNRPADEDHPYGHGKIEFITSGIEGGMVFFAGLAIGYEAIYRFFYPVPIGQIDLGRWLILATFILNFILGYYVYQAGKRYQCLPLITDGKHLLTDVFSTAGVLIALTVIRITNMLWIDSLIALIIAGVIIKISFGLMRQANDGLMDKYDPNDDKAIRVILDRYIQQNVIAGYHKVRHRHYGNFHWVDLHLQVKANLTVFQGHTIASQIENEIEQTLGQANATAHIEPENMPTESPTTTRKR